MSQLEIARQNLQSLFEAYSAATGAKLTTISQYVTTDGRFAQTMLERDFRIGTYDTILKNFSAIWPAALPWPDGVPRPDATDVCLRGPKSFRIHPEWSDNQEWPADVPLPDLNQTTVRGGSYGARSS